MDRMPAFNMLLEYLSWLVQGDQNRPCRQQSTWSEIIALAHEYRVPSTLACALECTADAGRVPREVIKFLTTILDGRRLRNAHVRKAAIEVGRILNEIGIAPVVMQGGAHILTGLYRDPGARQISDLDLLVPASRIDECREALRSHKFNPLSQYSHPRAHDTPLLGRKDLSVPIELHHQVLSFPYWNFLTPDEMYRTAAPLELSGTVLSVPSPMNAAIHNIAHAHMNDRDHLYGRLDLRGLLDLALLTKAHGDSIDWNDLERRFTSAGWRNALMYHLHWARRLGAEIPMQKRMSGMSNLLCRRAEYHVRKPHVLDRSFRMLRPFVLLRRELSDRDLRWRLTSNLWQREWWKRHLRMLRGA